MPLKVPLVGGVTTAKVRASPSTSEPASVRDRAAPLATATVCAVATGASFTGRMAIATVATLESFRPSFTLKVKRSVPCTLMFGV